MSKFDISLYPTLGGRLRGGWLTKISLLAAVHIVGGHLCFALGVTGWSVFPRWIPVGISLVALVRWGPQHWPGVLVGGVLFGITMGRSPAACACIAFGYTLASLVGALLLSRFAGPRVELLGVREILVFAGAGFVSPALSATMGAISLNLDQPDWWTGYARDWLGWWMVDTAGTFLIAPAMFVCSRSRLPSWNDWRRFGEWALTAAGLLTLTLVVFDSAPAWGRIQSYFGIFILPSLVYAVSRFGRLEVLLLVALVSAGAIWATMTGKEPAEEEWPLDDRFFLWTFVISLAVGSLLSMGLVASHERARAVERATRARFQALVERSIDGVTILDASGNVVYNSPDYGTELGYDLPGVLNRSAFANIHPDDLPRARDDWNALIGNPTVPVRSQLRSMHTDGTYRWIRSTARNLLHDPDVRGIVVSWQDITDQKLAEDEARFAHAHLFGIIDGTEDMVLSVDTELRPITWNRAYEREVDRIYGIRLERGRSVEELLPEFSPDRGKGAAFFARALGGESFTAVESFGDPRRARGTYELRLSPIRDGSGRIVAACEIVRDISERVRSERELTVAKSEAEAANRAKNEFLSRMSHELRTPLSAIIGFAQLLQMAPNSPRGREYAEQISNGGHHLLGLIDDILDLASIESNRISLAPKVVRVGDLFQEVIGLIRPLADRRGLSLRTDPPVERDLCLWADRRRLAQVFLNLLSNAVKYNRDGGSITLSCQPLDGNRLRISVADTGIGIPPWKADRLFHPFDRLDLENTILEGRGLGLAVSKRLIEAMGGTIQVESELERGTTFSVVLPRHR